METAFDALVYESDESADSKMSLRRSSRLSRTSELKVVIEEKPSTDKKPVRRSGRMRKPTQIKVESDDTKIEHDEMFKLAEKPAEILDSDDGHKVDKILGASEINGQIQFVFKWKDRDEPTMIVSAVANVKYPYHVLDFYESCMEWEEASDDEEGVAANIEKQC